MFFTVSSEIGWKSVKGVPEKTVVAHYRQVNSLRIKVVSNGYHLSSKEARDDGMDDGKGKAFDLPRRVFVTLKSCFNVVLASILVS